MDFNPTKIARVETSSATSIPSSSAFSHAPPAVDHAAMLNTLQCSVCMSLICEPISISCGHSFCRVCLVESLRRHQKRCPSCRAVCHVTAETASENYLIKSMALLVDQETYMLRLQEAQLQKESWTALYPVFYYNSAMFPGSRLSLHLFEPRYRQMMTRIVNTTQAFAYVPNFTNYQAQQNDVALIAKLKDVTMLPDGRCFLEAVLSGRYHIVDHFVEEGTMGLHFCRLVPFCDRPVTPRDQPLLSQLVTQTRILAEDVLAQTSGSQKTSLEQRIGPMPRVSSAAFNTALNSVTSSNTPSAVPAPTPASLSSSAASASMPAPPTSTSVASEAEVFSLWLTALTPLKEGEKMQWLRSTDTIARLQRCLEILSAMIAQRNDPTRLVNVTRATVSSALRGVVSAFLMRRNAQGGNEETEEEAEEEVEEEAVEEEEGSSDASTSTASSAVVEEHMDMDDHQQQEEGDAEEESNSEDINYVHANEDDYAHGGEAVDDDEVFYDNF